MSREAHVPFCEGPLGKFQRSTLLVFREDALKVTDPNGAKHLALFNRAALNALRQHKGKKDSLAGKRRRAGWSPAFRSELLFG